MSPDHLPMEDMWIQLMSNQTNKHVEVFVDGLIRVPRTAFDSKQQRMFKVDYTLDFSHAVPVSSRQNDIAIATCDGPELCRSSLAPIEFYSIVLATHCMEINSLQGSV